MAEPLSMDTPTPGEGSEAFFKKLLAKSNNWPDAAAKHDSVHNGAPQEEQERRFNLLTGRLVHMIDGTLAFACGYWPHERRDNYLHPPARNFDFPDDETSVNRFDYGLAHNSLANVPLPIAWIDDARMVLPRPADLKPGTLRDENGEIVFSSSWEPLRDLKLLPRYISTEVEGWRLLYWLTLDPRITYRDIIARMRFLCTEKWGEGPLEGGIEQVTQTLMGRVDRFRREHGILAPLRGPFDPDTYEVTEADVEAISKLDDCQLAYGTWWTIDTARGIMYPPKPEDDSIPWRKEQYLLPKLAAGPTPRMLKILEHCRPKPRSTDTPILNGTNLMLRQRTSLVPTSRKQRNTMVPNAPNGITVGLTNIPQSPSLDFVSQDLNGVEVQPWNASTPSAGGATPKSTVSKKKTPASKKHASISQVNSGRVAKRARSSKSKPIPAAAMLHPESDYFTRMSADEWLGMPTESAFDPALFNDFPLFNDFARPSTLTDSTMRSIDTPGSEALIDPSMLNGFSNEKGVPEDLAHTAEPTEDFDTYFANAFNPTYE